MPYKLDFFEAREGFFSYTKGKGESVVVLGVDCQLEVVVTHGF